MQEVSTLYFIQGKATFATENGAFLKRSTNDAVVQLTILRSKWEIPQKQCKLTPMNHDLRHSKNTVR